MSLSHDELRGAVRCVAQCSQLECTFSFSFDLDFDFDIDFSFDLDFEFQFNFGYALMCENCMERAKIERLVFYSLPPYTNLKLDPFLISI